MNITDQLRIASRTGVHRQLLNEAADEIERLERAAALAVTRLSKADLEWCRAASEQRRPTLTDILRRQEFCKNCGDTPAFHGDKANTCTNYEASK